ncbi:MAG: S9 family peptidase [Gemmatimonadetes bacterium]|nr:S9 family peptidase [Gemmatimonadota bacterium]
MRTVSGPVMSPDGQWVAYTVMYADSTRDKRETNLWMASWDGATTLQLTRTPGSESRPKWSPDGTYLAFLSARSDGSATEADDHEGAQIWLLDRRGGEAFKLTDIKAGVSDYAWSPDSQRMVLVVSDTAVAPPLWDSVGAKGKAKTAKPHVIDRYHFKQDVEGYLGPEHDHLYLFDVGSRKAVILTPGSFDESLPAWSPDGTRIAFISNHTADPDRNSNTDVFVIEARPGAEARQLTTTPGEDGNARPAWSPDGSVIAYLQGGDPKYWAYDQPALAVVPAVGGTPRILAPKLDRDVRQPVFSADGEWVLFQVDDDRATYLARVPTAGGAVEALTSGRRVIRDVTISGGSDGHIAVLSTTPTQPSEVWALDGGSLRALSHHNDAWLAGVQLGVLDGLEAKAKDGNEVHAVFETPADIPAGTKSPMLLRIHGGPHGQNSWAFDLEREIFVANGYAVLSPNYRGSDGRGAAYARSIYADWGNKEVVDLLASVDAAVATGRIDANRLGIGGWSYGGILTDYTIASDTRFKAAISGAGSAAQMSMYGHDEYIMQWEQEVGLPWKGTKLWDKLSYPFLHADRITTPTLFLGGSEDFNVPIIGGEQMYQALKSLGVETELVVYPGQFHGFTTPSYLRDRWIRYLAWYGKYLGAG